jgi:hypothetical protein
MHDVARSLRLPTADGPLTDRLPLSDYDVPDEP